MADASEVGLKGFTFTWYIENFSFCWQNQGMELRSPTFKVDWMKGAVYHLTLYPRGLRGQDIIMSVESDNRCSTVVSNFELSFLDDKGSVLHARSYEVGKLYMFLNICLKRDDAIVQRRVDFLHQDTLTARCRIWKGQGVLSEARQSFARTRIAVKRISFYHVVEDFSSLRPNEKRFVHMQSEVNETPLISMSVSLTDGLCCEERVVAEIVFAKDQQVKYCQSVLSLLDAEGNEMECGQGEAKYDRGKADALKLVLTKSKQALMETRYKYLPKDVLTLRCECAFSTGIQFETIEQSVYGLHLMPKSPPPSLEEKANSTARLAGCSSVLDDLESLYKYQILSDVKFKTKTATFPVHKAVLCARSSVFRAMFESDMRERTRNCIEVEDLEDGTVRRFLHFLYTDFLEELQWDIATNLYYAADMYQVHRLKMECSSFLEDNLDSSNAIELLVLADTHQDPRLKTKVEDFICEHDE